MIMGNKLMMKLLIASEGVFFLSLIVAYLYFWRTAHFTEEAIHMLNIRSGALFTLMLVSSSCTLYMAERGLQKGHPAKARYWLGGTLLLGLVFLAGQANEYYHLIEKKLSLDYDVFGTGFFSLTGFHMLHVLMGLVALGIILWIAVKNYPADRKNLLTVAGMYWHFVDAVWIILFTLIYVLPYFLRS